MSRIEDDSPARPELDLEAVPDLEAVLDPVPSLAVHPDRVKWNAKFAGQVPSFVPHPVARQALPLVPPGGPVLELACGASGSALLAAGRGHPVTAVDIADAALGLLAAEAARRGLAGLLTVTQADLYAWSPPPGHWALVLCTGFWDAAVFAAAAAAVTPGGLLAWEGLTTDARRLRPSLRPAWCLAPGEPATLLPPGFAVLDGRDVPDPRCGTKRRLLARRLPGHGGESDR